MINRVKTPALVAAQPAYHLLMQHVYEISNPFPDPRSSAFQVGRHWVVHEPFRDRPSRSRRSRRCYRSGLGGSPRSPATLFLTTPFPPRLFSRQLSLATDFVVRRRSPLRVYHRRRAREGKKNMDALPVLPPFSLRRLRCWCGPNCLVPFRCPTGDLAKARHYLPYKRLQSENTPQKGTDGQRVYQRSDSRQIYWKASRRQREDGLCFG